jgi:hypothetical protein
VTDYISCAQTYALIKFSYRGRFAGIVFSAYCDVLLSVFIFLFLFPVYVFVLSFGQMSNQRSFSVYFFGVVQGSDELKRVIDPELEDEVFDLSEDPKVLVRIARSTDVENAAIYGRFSWGSTGLFALLEGKEFAVSGWSADLALGLEAHLKESMPFAEIKQSSIPEIMKPSCLSGECLSFEIVMPEIWIPRISDVSHALRLYEYGFYMGQNIQRVMPGVFLFPPHLLSTFNVGFNPWSFAIGGDLGFFNIWSSLLVPSPVLLELDPKTYEGTYSERPKRFNVQWSNVEHCSQRGDINSNNENACNYVFRFRVNKDINGLGLIANAGISHVKVPVGIFLYGTIASTFIFYMLAIAYFLGKLILVSIHGRFLNSNNGFVDVNLAKEYSLWMILSVGGGIVSLPLLWLS